jgi:Ala-tRNA(Pro) deacylase
MDIRSFLKTRQVAFQLMLHSPAPCATRLAQSLHVSGHHVAKAVLLRAGGGYILGVLPATHRIDFDRLADVLGLREIRLATEDEVECVFTDCERGALPPFGRLYGLTTVIDCSLPREAEIVFEGNLRHEGVRMRCDDYEALENPVRAGFAVEMHARSAVHGSHRRAG